MAMGGGTFTSMNKKLAGTYINFVSAARANASLGERGIVTMPLALNWGVDNEIFTVTQEDFIKNSLGIFGYAYDAPEMKGLRDLFINAQKLFAYKLTSGGAKAASAYATAKYCGTRGNDLKVVIAVNVDNNDKYDVSLYLGTALIDTQTVATAAELVDNDFVIYKKDAVLEVTAGTPLTAGTNGSVDGAAHQAYLTKIEAYSFNTMGVVTSDAATIKVYEAFTKRMRENVGVKFQCVLFGGAADYEGVINVKNSVELVYWVTGAEGACAVNESVTNKLYDGEYEVSADYTQSELEACIDAGEFVLHRVGDDIRVLSDINSLVTETDEKGTVFKSNQTIRVIDQIANEVALLFNTKYVGRIPNDASGRTSLWSDIVSIEQRLNDIRAIEGFSENDVQISAGETKKAVIITNAITPVNAMEQLYMSVSIA